MHDFAFKNLKFSGGYTRTPTAGGATLSCIPGSVSNHAGRERE